MKIFRLNYLILCLLFSTAVLGQTQKLEKTFKTNSDVTVDVDVSHVNIVVDYWDKDAVEVKAFIETAGKEAQQEDLKRALEDWKLDLSGSAGKVSIRSTGGMGFPTMDLATIQAPVVRIPEIMVPLQEMIGPLVESISAAPLPPEFYESMGNIHFDYEAYRKDGDKYLKQFEKKIEKNFGKDFEKSMEEWAKRFENDTILKKRIIVMEDMSKDMEKKMEAWGEQFGQQMEAWGESFGKNMESWAAEMEKHAEAAHRSGNNVIIINGSTKVKKTIRVNMPKEGHLKLNVRHGEVNLSGNTKDLTGQLSHSKLTAASVSGEKTDIKVAYSPVTIKQWEYGRLNASYVQELHIEKVKSIKLTSNSSDVSIGQLQDNGIFRGTFGELVIDNLDNNFKSVDIYLENSDLKLDLPESAAFSFNYTGNKSRVQYPEDLSVSTTNSYDNERLSGFHKNKNAAASISINASFSEVLLK